MNAMHRSDTTSQDFIAGFRFGAFYIRKRGVWANEVIVIEVNAKHLIGKYFSG